jgi:L-aminopeptidase/D-esterase-like protein
MERRMRAWIALSAALVGLAVAADLKVHPTPADLKVRTTPANDWKASLSGEPVRSADQPPPRLRRSAVASAKAESLPPPLARSSGELRRGSPKRLWREGGALQTMGGVLQAARPADANATLTAVPGIKVGHHTLTARPTGCTVVLIEGGATAGVDVRGAAPATRDTDLLNPTKMAEQIHGIALSGGSLFGLSSGDGVLRYLEAKNVGIAFGNRRIPIVPGASIFDLRVGDPTIRPAADCGYRAAQAATAAPVVEGSVGAGAGATLGKLGGIDRAMKSGVGSAAIRMPDGLIVAALVVVNPLGDVIDPATGKVVAGVRAPGGNGFADARVMIRSGAPRATGGGDNSTIGVVATNARLTKAQASYLAQLTDDGYARAIWPIHTMVDGDAVFAIATGGKPGDPDLVTLGALAADVMSTAVVRAATQATGLPNLPAVRDLR